jgi:heme A synthase
LLPSKRLNPKEQVLHKLYPCPSHQDFKNLRFWNVYIYTYIHIYIYYGTPVATSDR